MPRYRFAENRSAIGTAIREKRIALKMDQRDVAEALGVDRSYIAKVETGAKVPTVLFLLAIAEVLHTTMDELCKPEE